MNIAVINTVPYGSTGRICLDIAEHASKCGHRTLCAFGYTRKGTAPDGCITIGGFFSKGFHKVASYLTGGEGCFSFLATWRLIRQLERFSPDVLHLHNLHGHYLNLPLLFRYIKRSRVRVIWTLHDCWSVTGHCTHFDGVRCDRWRTGCHDCPILQSYPASRWDNTARTYRRKRAWFGDVADMTIVTPSHWLAGVVKQSFLRDHPVRVIQSGIDLSVFRPTSSRFRELHGLVGYHIVLGVAYVWSKSKGLDVFRKLAERLDATTYRIVLVGFDRDRDGDPPSGVLPVPRTEDAAALAALYTAADVFVNPTKEETLGMVNLEALACGTPGITFASGGSPECYDETCGSVVPTGDIEALEREILRVCETHPYSAEVCRGRALHFDQQEMCRQYVRLYEGMGDTDGNTAPGG